MGAGSMIGLQTECRPPWRADLAPAVGELCEGDTPAVVVCPARRAELAHRMEFPPLRGRDGESARPLHQLRPRAQCLAEDATMFRSILVPLDGTRFGEQALPLAAELARRCDATLHLVQVITPVVVGDNLAQYAVIDSESTEDVSAYLAERVRELGPTPPV